MPNVTQRLPFFLNQGSPLERADYQLRDLNLITRKHRFYSSNLQANGSSAVVHRADLHKLEGIVTLPDVLDAYCIDHIGIKWKMAKA